MSAAESNTELRKATKLLRQLDQLAAKRAGGASLNKDEETKLNRRGDVVAYLKTLGVDVPDVPDVPPVSVPEPMDCTTTNVEASTQPAQPIVVAVTQQPVVAAVTPKSVAAAKPKPTSKPTPKQIVTAPRTLPPAPQVFDPSGPQPAAAVGDVLRIRWPQGSELELIKAEVLSIEKCADVQHNSAFKYTLRVLDVPVKVGTSVPHRVTRLLNMKWRHISHVATHVFVTPQRKHQEVVEVAPQVESSDSSDSEDEKQPKKAKVTAVVKAPAKEPVKVPVVTAKPVAVASTQPVAAKKEAVPAPKPVETKAVPQVEKPVVVVVAPTFVQPSTPQAQPVVQAPVQTTVQPIVQPVVQAPIMPVVSRSLPTVTPKAKRPAPVHSKVLAPMVGGSELAFRLLCRRYGVDLAYTPMMMSDQFVNDSEYRAKEFQTSFADRPLVAHFAANNPHTFMAAARLVENKCDAVDLNLGCPQRIAHSGHFGSFLLDDSDRELVLNMVRTVSAAISVPLFVKIRLLNTVDETITLVRQLHEAGAYLIAVHARHRVPLGQKPRAGPAYIDQVAAIKAALPHIPILCNGNVRTGDDAECNLIASGADGIMSAEGLLDDPALFVRSASPEGVPSRLQLAFEYLGLVDSYPVPIKSVVFHVRRMAKQELTQFQLLDDCIACTTIAQVRDILSKARDYASGQLAFVPRAVVAAAPAVVAVTVSANDSARKEFEARMQRKAKREGKPLDHYLKLGAALPTDVELKQLKEMDKDAAFAVWKEKHAQHCFNLHLGADSCTNQQCPFLHSGSTSVAIVSSAPAVASEDTMEVFG